MKDYPTFAFWCGCLSHGDRNYERRLKSKYSLPWLCAGDFNEITRAHEKSGGRLRPSKQMEDFRDVLDECGF